MGLKLKYWDISLHTVPEVEYDGRWHMYDNSMSALYTLCDGRTLAGVADIGKPGACAASGGVVVTMDADLQDDPAEIPALKRKLEEGYDLVSGWKKVRHDYYQTLLDLFIERWGKPYHDACEKAGLQFTGHYWEHEWPRCLLVPDNMAMYAWFHVPGIDMLFNQFAETVNAQFGNARSVKELSSVANQLGLRRTLCEAYGAGGWDLRFEDMKRIGDWLQVLGVVEQSGAMRMLLARRHPELGSNKGVPAGICNRCGRNGASNQGKGIIALGQTT